MNDKQQIKEIAKAIIAEYNENLRKETAKEIITMLKDYYGKIRVIDSIKIRYDVEIEE